MDPDAGRLKAKIQQVWYPGIPAERSQPITNGGYRQGLQLRGKKS